MSPPLSLAGLNRLDRAGFVAFLGDVFEHSPWVAEGAAAQAPFASREVLHAAMVAVVEAAGEERQLALLRAHPELARRETLTDASAGEQRGAGLDRLDPALAARMDTLNAAYRERFGIPFIIAVRGARTPEVIVEALARRLDGTVDGERREALAQVAMIARFRLGDRVREGWVSTHVLDIASGRPARGVPLALSCVEGSGRTPLAQAITNEDGRTDAPLLAPAEMAAGQYELVFETGAWREEAGMERGFHDAVPIRFRIDDDGAHYHVPLILAPFGYSTYRGS